MGLDSRLVPLVDWEQLANGQHRVVRMDVLETDRGLSICEMNFSAAVGGGELHRHYQAFADCLHPWPATDQPAPLDNLAAMYAASEALRDVDRVQVLDWSSHARLGYASGTIAAQHLRRGLAGRKIELHDELSWKRQAAAGDAMRGVLIHRCFTYDDVTENIEVYHDMLASGARFSNGLEAELLMSKGWLSSLWDPAHRDLLDAAEQSAIDAWLIPTYDVAVQDKTDLLERKDALLFKRKNAYGGMDVIPGRSMDGESLWTLMGATAIADWVYQPLLDTILLRHLAADGSGPKPHRLVLGLYLHEGRGSGIVTRSALDTLIVNAGSGACAGWAPVLDAEQRHTLIEGLRQAD